MLPDVYEFYNLGIGDPHPISSLNKMGLGDMLDEVTALFPKDLEEEEDERPRIAIVGKPNVGKSSLINKLLGENRVIVSDVAGTTRDAIDTDICWEGKDYVLLIQRDSDAKIRSRKKLSDIVFCERYRR